MFVQDILTDICACIELICKDVLPDFADITETWKRSAKVYIRLLKIMYNCSRRRVSENNKSFDVKTYSFEGDQLTMLRSLIVRLSKIIKNLKIKSDRISQKLKDNSSSFGLQRDVLQFTIRGHLTWIEDCRSSFNFIYMKMNVAMTKLDSSYYTAFNLLNAITPKRDHNLIIQQAHNRMKCCSFLLQKVKDNK